MGDVLFLAWSYLRRHRMKALTLAVCLSVVLALPLTVHGLVNLLQTQMVDRARQTPLVIGPAGSRFDLVLHALYFQAEAPGTIPQGERQAIETNADVATLPLFVRYEAAGHPIVGTSLDYFDFRALVFAEGRPFTRLGDAVVGAAVAERLGIRPGDRLISDPENVFDLGGSYPLNMRVTGVLERTRSADDHGVFVDVRTAWVIAGIGHGHEEVDEATAADAAVDDDADEGVLRATPTLQRYTEITDENVATFHFHGDPENFPLTAIIALPADDRAATLLRGRYVEEGAAYQALRPSEVVDELLGMIVQLRRFFDAQHGLILATTALLLGLVMSLSLRLRRVEMQTMFHLGCSRGMIAALMGAELLILATLSAVLASGISWLVLQIARGWVQALTV